MKKPTQLVNSRNNGLGGNEEMVLKDIKVPTRYYRRIDLGVPALNEIFGGQEMPGVFAGASYVFTGTPGAGKSTLALQLADLFQSMAGRNTVYNVGEENAWAIKVRADRIGVKQEFSIINKDQVDDLIDYCKRKGVEIIFQDSLQSLNDGDLKGGEKLKSVVKKLTRFCSDNGVTLFLIGHSVKNGRFAGPQEIIHDPDGHIHLKVNPETGGRVFQFEKNRWGPASIPYEFTISATGLNFSQITAEELNGGEKANVSKTAERRDRINEFIKEKLLAGERISGYCFERFDVDCSGGFWRGMLEKAAKELKVEGHDIGEVKDGPSGKGRAHKFLRPPEPKGA